MRLPVILVLLLAFARAEEHTEDLADLSLEDLMDIDVVSVAKSEQSLLDAAAAISVLTGEDIRRSGHLSIPEALRMAPGLHVARAGSHDWSVSSRGFPGLFANKLLVLQDGRSLYTPLFSGVFWDTQDVFLDDIERIEVMRGPGAALWGANAVSGFINILTKEAKDTQGTVAYGGGGFEETGFAGMRHGGRLGESGHFRVYAKGFMREPMTGGDDDWAQTRGGFRMDWEPDDTDRFTVQGDIYAGTFDTSLALITLTPPFAEMVESHAHVTGGNLLGRWTRTGSDRSEWMVQAYYDRTKRTDVVLGIARDTFEIEVNRRFAPVAENHEILAGVEYRAHSVSTVPSFIVALDSDDHSDSLFSGYLQWCSSYWDDHLRVTVGAEMEEDSHSGFEFQPCMRAVWAPDPAHRVWSAISRGVRTPSQVEHDVRLNIMAFDQGMGPTLVSIFGNESFISEEVLSFEAGYRHQARKNLVFDVAVFYSEFDKLRSLLPGVPGPELDPPPPHILVPNTMANGGSAENYGVEVTARWRPWSRLELIGNYSFLRVQEHYAPGHTSTGTVALEGQSPQSQFQLMSRFDLPRNLEFDLGVYFVDSLGGLGVPGYIRLDAHLTWRPSDTLALDVGVQNILDGNHPEFSGELRTSLPTEIDAAAYFRLTKRF